MTGAVQTGSAMAIIGGIDENAGEIRSRIMDHLAFLDKVPVRVIPAADQEKQIARNALPLLAQHQARERKP